MSEKPEALRLAELLDEPYPLHSQMPMAAAELRRLHAECEALRADAGRYRWIRNPVTPYPQRQMDNGYYANAKMEFLDAAIDAAMAKEQTK